LYHILNLDIEKNPSFHKKLTENIFIFVRLFYYTFIKLFLRDIFHRTITCFTFT